MGVEVAILKILENHDTDTDISKMRLDSILLVMDLIITVKTITTPS